MKRLVFGGCVGWLHADTGTTADIGVVLCAPQGHEAMWTHRAWRHLADDLAATGVPVLRFDYEGTGDAAGTGDEPDFIPRAVANITAAAALLRAQTGVGRVVLCGLRLGALLAALAAAKMADSSGPAVAGLVMLAPVVDGRSYLRELRALHAGWRNSAIPELVPPPAPPGAQDVLSFRIDAATVTAIQGLRLDALPEAPAPRMLWLDAWPDPASPVAALARQYKAAGAQVEVEDFAEYPSLMQSAEYAAVPPDAWARVIGWVMALSPTLATSAASNARLQTRSAPTRSPLPPAHAMAARHIGVEASFDADGVIEQSVWIDNGRLFGVLCTPGASSGRRTPATTAVIFPNTGGNHHAGDGRMFVDLSRRLARQGMAALRLDVSALGDSPGAWRQMNLSAIYARTPRQDVSTAVEWMRARGFRHIVLAGVCSGAFLSLHAALANHCVNGLVLANLVKFRWDAADDAAATDQLRSARVYLAAMGKWENWRRLCSGQIGARRLITAMARRIWYRVRESGAQAAGPSRDGEDHATVAAFARAAVRELDRRGVRTDFLYGASDVGLHEARLGLGKQMEGLDDLPLVNLRILPMLDHSLFLEVSREAFADHLLEHLSQVQAQAQAQVQARAPSRPAAAPASEPARAPVREPAPQPARQPVRLARVVRPKASPVRLRIPAAARRGPVAKSKG
ncbi:Alpha/beta hydrolase family protein [Cupriavidus sp. YR651]|uniref:serine aminopeptidase domain-containing protein n=1 Tax=Cupriavidus sp. YR651 TaxID=1855315 RepID=UPI000884D569|nr:alpha/beta hydrolase [Cupriavidus sp. YR651]SDD36347.1 Alpha/beta hydrolase family protein [Cupriavidus sp. YR651]